MGIAHALARGSLLLTSIRKYFIVVRTIANAHQALIAQKMIGAFERHVDISALIVCTPVQWILLMCAVEKNLIQSQVDSCFATLTQRVRFNCEAYPTGTNASNIKVEEAVLARCCKMESV